MPKRPNPFADHSPLQFKTHVGLKEVANGSMGGKMMTEVFERTQEKLFSATQQRLVGDVNANHAMSRMQPAHQAAAVTPQWNCDRRQMTLDTAGHLTHPNPSDFPKPFVSEQQAWHFGQDTEMSSDKKSEQAMDSAQCGQRNGCGQFGSWMDYNGGAFRQQSPIASMPASGGQLCLDSNGHLTAPAPQQASAMDCDSALPQKALPSANGVEKSFSAAGQGAKCWSGFPFMSAAKRQSSQAGKQSFNVKCATCRHNPSCVDCQFCERRLCGGCGRQCDACGQLFCPLCSTLNYDTSVERAFCLSCVG